MAMVADEGDGALLTRSKKKMKPLHPRDSGCCSVTFIKCVLHIFNVIFFIAGLGVLGVVLWLALLRQWFAPVLSSILMPLATYALAAAGAAAVPVALLGWCGLRTENRTILLCYTYFLLLIFLMEAGLGALAYHYEEQIDQDLKNNLNSTLLESYNLLPKQTKAIDEMQMEFKCCGADSYRDWQRGAGLLPGDGRRRLVPDSCCKTVRVSCGSRDHPSNIYYEGCSQHLSDYMRAQLIILSSVGIGTSIIPFFGFFFSCCLYIRVKHVID